MSLEHNVAYISSPICTNQHIFSKLTFFHRVLSERFSLSHNFTNLVLMISLLLSSLLWHLFTITRSRCDGGSWRAPTRPECLTPLPPFLPLISSTNPSYSVTLLLFFFLFFLFFFYTSLKEAVCYSLVVYFCALKWVEPRSIYSLHILCYSAKLLYHVAYRFIFAFISSWRATRHDSWWV